MLNKLSNETNLQYIKRIVEGKLVDKTIDDDFVELYMLLFGKEISSTEARKRFYGILDAFESESFEENIGIDNFESQMIQLENKRREIEKERQKLSTTKIEYNKWLRDNARDELIVEKICEEIAKLKPLEFPNVIPRVCRSTSGVLVFGDEHYGAELKITGLYGETLNEYSPEIFERRMEELLEQTIRIVDKEGFNTINVFNAGDFSDGLLRVGQLMKLRYGVVESTVRYSNYMINWLNELTKYVRVNFQKVDGNHTELRMLGQPKGTFSEDNMGLVFDAMLNVALADNPNFNYIKNPTGYIFDTISGFNVLGIHGEVKNMEQAIKNFSHTYKVPIDVLIAGHLHHTRSETIGVNRDVINVPSIIGVDDFALSLHKTSNAGATFIILEEGKGKVQEYNIKLD